MKRTAKVLLILLLATALGFAALVAWQWRNVKPLYTAKTNSVEEIAQRASRSKEQQRIVLDENEVPLVPPSLDQLDRLIDGQASSEELKAELGLVDETTEPSSSEASPEPELSQEAAETLTEEQRAEKARERIDGCVRELYAYEVDLTADVGVLKQEAVDEYQALPEEEKTRENAIKIGYRYLNECYDLEADSDRRVRDILERLRGDLEALEADATVVDTLWEHYCEEKTITKEYYLSKYL